MLYVSGSNHLLTFLLVPTLLLAGVGVFFALARWSFERAWGEFRTMRQERLARISGLLSPALEGARHDPFRHLSDCERLSFNRLGPAPGCPVVESSQGKPPETHPIFDAIREWEDHHHSVSRSFVDALAHVAHHKLVPHTDLHQKVEPIPIEDALQQLIEQCIDSHDSVMLKELRMAHSGLKTGAEQNLEYISRRLEDTARETHSAFHATLGSAHSELSRLREDMIQTICREADDEIEKFLDTHRGLCFNPFVWGRQTAYYREFEHLRDELDKARGTGNLAEIALIVVMIVEDETHFVNHLHAASRSHDEVHRRLSHELRKSAEQIHVEVHTLAGWASQENQRLQSSVSHQLIQFLESKDHPQLEEWIQLLANLRDQDPELSDGAAA